MFLNQSGGRARLGLMLLFACVFAISAHAQISGAIYTSLKYGQLVNGNNYESKGAV